MQQSLIDCSSKEQNADEIKEFIAENHLREFKSQIPCPNGYFIIQTVSFD
jgi:hypothetical protein